MPRVGRRACTRVDPVRPEGRAGSRKCRSERTTGRRGERSRAGRRGAECARDGAGDGSCAHAGGVSTWLWTADVGGGRSEVHHRTRTTVRSDLSPCRQPSPHLHRPSSVAPVCTLRALGTHPVINRSTPEQVVPSPSSSIATLALMQPVQRASRLLGAVRRSATATASAPASQAPRRANSTYRPPTPPSAPRPSVKQVGESRPDRAAAPAAPSSTAQAPSSPSNAPSRPSPSELLTVLEETIKVRRSTYRHLSLPVLTPAPCRRMDRSPCRAS